jgi:hypothetical protein
MSKAAEIRLPQPVSLAEIMGIDPQQHPFLLISEASYQTLSVIREWCISRCVWPEDNEQGEASNSMDIFFHTDLSQVPWLARWFTPEFATHPEAATFQERLELSGEYYSWLYFQDDNLANDIQQGMAEESKAVVEKALKIVFGFLEGKIGFTDCLDKLSVFHDSVPAGTGGLVAKIAYALDAFEQLTQRMYTVVQQDAQLHPEDGDLPFIWFKDMQTNLKAHLLEALTNQDKNLPKNGVEYLLGRRKVSGMTFATHLSQFVYRCYLPKQPTSQVVLNYQPEPLTSISQQINHPFLQNAFEELYPALTEPLTIDQAVHRLATLSEDYGGVGNDLVSVLKELKENSLFNLVSLVWGNTT